MQQNKEDDKQKTKAASELLCNFINPINSTDQEPNGHSKNTTELRLGSKPNCSQELPDCSFGFFFFFFLVAQNKSGTLHLPDNSPINIVPFLTTTPVLNSCIKTSKGHVSLRLLTRSLWVCIS